MHSCSLSSKGSVEGRGMPHPAALMPCPSHVLLHPCTGCCSDFPVLGAARVGSLECNCEVQEMVMDASKQLEHTLAIGRVLPHRAGVWLPRADRL